MKKTRSWRYWWREVRLNPKLSILTPDGEWDVEQPYFWAGFCLRLRLEKDPLTIPIKIRLGFFKSTGRYQL